MSWKHKRNFVCQEEPRFNWRHDGDIRWHNSPEFDYESKCYFEFPQYEWRSIKANAKRHTLTSFQCRVKQNKFICKCYFSTHILNAFMSISATTRINERQTDEDITNNKSDSDMLNRQSLSMFSSNWQWFLIKSVDKCKVYKKGAHKEAKHKTAQDIALWATPTTNKGSASSTLYPANW